VVPGPDLNVCGDHDVREGNRHAVAPQQEQVVSHLFPQHLGKIDVGELREGCFESAIVQRVARAVQHLSLGDATDGGAMRGEELLETRVT